MVIAEALAAARECHGFVGLTEMLGETLAGGKSSVDAAPVTADRQLAYQELLTRCQGFLRATPKERLALIRQLQARHEAIAPDQARAMQAADSSDHALSVLLTSDSPHLRQQALGPLMRRWAALNSATDPADRKGELGGLAAMLAVCELGNHCGAASFPGLFQCAMTARCDPQGWLASWDAELSAQEAAQVLQYKAQIVEAIRHGDVSRLRSP